MTSWTDRTSEQFPGFEVVEFFSPAYSGEDIQPMLVGNLLPMSAPGMLVGEPGCFKTQLALTLCIGVATGTSVLEQEVEDAYPVIYVANEGSPRDLAARVARISTDMGIEGTERKLLEDYLTVFIPGGDSGDFAPVTPIAIYKIVRARVHDCSRPGLLVIDTLAPLITGEENSAESARGIWAMASAISNTFGWTVLFLHHKRKGYGRKGSTPTGNDLSEIRGTSAHGASARFILGISRIRKAHKGFAPPQLTGDLLELKMIKRNDGPEGFSLNLSSDPNTGLLRAVLPSSESVRDRNEHGAHARTVVETKGDQVLRIYQDSETPEEIKKERALRVFQKASDPDAALRSALRRLRNKGRL